jgi:hypothetical protein
MKIYSILKLWTECHCIDCNKQSFSYHISRFNYVLWFYWWTISLSVALVGLVQKHIVEQILNVENSMSQLLSYTYARGFVVNKPASASVTKISAETNYQPTWAPSSGRYFCTLCGCEYPMFGITSPVWTRLSAFGGCTLTSSGCSSPSANPTFSGSVA